MSTSINIEDNTIFHSILEVEDMTNVSDNFYSLAEDIQSEETNENSDVTLTLEENVSEAIKTGKVNKEILRRMQEEFQINILDFSEYVEEDSREDVSIDINSEALKKNIKVKEDTLSQARDNGQLVTKETEIQISTLREKLERILLFHRDSKRPFSTLLYGLPGAGKSFILDKIAKEFGFSYRFVSSTEFKSDLHGQSEAKLKAIFEEASRTKPTILVIEEVDSLIKDRDSKEESSEVSSSLKNLLLNILSGTEEVKGVFVFFTTNFPWKLDKAFRNRMSVTTRVHSPSKEVLFQFFSEEIENLGYKCNINYKDFISKVDLTHFDFRIMQTLINGATENVQMMSMKAPHTKYFSREPIKVIGCYCRDQCDKTEKQGLNHYSSEQIRCGEIKIEHVIQAKKRYNIISTADKKDIEKLNYFEKYGKIPEENKDKYLTNISSDNKVVLNCVDQYEWMGFFVTISLGLFIILMLSSYGVI